MSHDQHLILGNHELSERLCLYSCLYSCVFRHLLTLAAVVLDAVLVFNDRLIPASCKRKIDRHTGIVIALSIGVFAEAKTDTECRRNLVPDTDFFYIIENGKMVFLHFVEIKVFYNNEIAVF